MISLINERIMKKTLILFFLFVAVFELQAQRDTVMIKSRKVGVPLQANAFIETYSQLYKGQEYTLRVVASSDYDIRIQATNAHIQMTDRGDKSTAGISYYYTPIDTGECTVTIGVIVGEGRQTSLLSRTYMVIDYPVPPVVLNEFISGTTITSLSDSMVLSCNYSPSTGILDRYPVESWRVKIEDDEFTGNGNYLTSDVMERIKSLKSGSIVHFEVNLADNKTGHSSSQGVFIIEQESKK